MANLLRVDIYELTDALTQKSMILRGEEIQSPLSVEQVGQLGDVYIIYIYIYIYIARQSAGNSWRTFTKTLRIVEISIPCKK